MVKNVELEPFKNVFQAFGFHLSESSMFPIRSTLETFLSKKHHMGAKMKHT